MSRPAHIRPIFGEYYCDPQTTEPRPGHNGGRVVR